MILRHVLELPNRIFLFPYNRGNLALTHSYFIGNLQRTTSESAHPQYTSLLQAMGSMCQSSELPATLDKVRGTHAHTQHCQHLHSGYRARKGYER